MRTVTTYQSYDGQSFESQAAAMDYEDARIAELCEATEKDVRDALDRKNIALADLIESMGASIAKARREAGALRRGSKTAEPAVDKPKANGKRQRRSAVVI